MGTERRFDVMGTFAHVVVVGAGEAALDAAQHRLIDLDRRWSRFRDDSEISQLNRAGGPVVLPPDTFDVIERAIAAWYETDGRFDPTVHDALVAAGYDRTFAEISHVGTALVSAPLVGCSSILCDRPTCTVFLPEGVSVDLGGIGKGEAADIVTSELAELGAAGTCVNVGGDLRVEGKPPTDDGWIVDIEGAERDGRPVRLCLLSGAVCTTTSQRRRWSGPEGERHHVIDPATGQSTEHDLDLVTVVAGTAARGEVIAKAAFIAGPGAAADVIEEMGGAGVLVSSGEVATFTPSLPMFLP